MPVCGIVTTLCGFWNYTVGAAVTGTVRAWRSCCSVTAHTLWLLLCVEQSAVGSEIKATLLPAADWAGL